MFSSNRDLAASGLVQAFLEWGATNLSPGTVYYYALHLRRFEKTVAGVPLDQLRKWHLTAWESRFHPLQAVKRLFSWAVSEAELLTRSPFENVRLPSLGQRKRVLSPLDAATLLRAAGRPFRAFLIAMRETIARPQEIRGVRWEHLFPCLELVGSLELFRVGRGRFVLEEYKARRRRSDPSAPRIIPCPPRVGRLIVRLARGRRPLEGFIFLNTVGKPWTNNAVRCEMRALRKRVGLEGDHRGEKVVAYTFRHTSATEASAMGLRDKLLSEIMGHTSPRMTHRYLHLSQEHLVNAMLELHAKKMKRRRPLDPPPC